MCTIIQQYQDRLQTWIPHVRQISHSEVGHCMDRRYAMEYLAPSGKLSKFAGPEDMASDFSMSVKCPEMSNLTSNCERLL